MALFDDLAQFKTAGFPSDYPANVRRFYSPQDKVHDAIKCLLSSATESLLVSMYGEDDPELTAIIIQKAKDPSVFVQINLDKTQAAGTAEKSLVTELEGAPSCRVAIGMSEFHKINHLKMTVVDGLYTLSGSTNWSADGEGKQNNEASILCDRVVAHEATTVLNLEHQQMLTQMGNNAPNP
jgi:phosphatidylserine/phosphatidylglycerophosphate/cardiolipin synthase-like enzyme